MLLGERENGIGSGGRFDNYAKYKTFLEYFSPFLEKISLLF